MKDLTVKCQIYRSILCPTTLCHIDKIDFGIVMATKTND